MPRLIFAFLAPFVAALVFAQTEGDEADDDQSFEIPGGDTTSLDGDAGVDLQSMDAIGGPLKRLAANWPEDLVIAPIPGYSPQIGWNLTLAGGYFLGSREEDSGVAPSILGGFGMIAENGSYAYGGGLNLHLLDDNLRVKAGAGYMDVRYRYYGTGNLENDLGISVNILQEAPMYFATASWRVWRKLYVGLGYLASSVDTRLRFSTGEDPFGNPFLSPDIGAITIPIDYDSRDHEQFPRSGWLISLKNKFYRKSAGSDFDAETYKLAVNHYMPFRDQDVLALRAVIRLTEGDAPFFLKSTFGGSTDLRGYPSGRYRDRMMYSMQGEYRWQLNESWRLTGFAGFGEVAESVGDFGENFLPAAGIGARYVLSKKHKVGLSTDIAVGNDGWEFYFGVGEAF